MLTSFIYLAGPITGVPDGNKPLFDRVANKLRLRGYQVINPWEFEEGEIYIETPDLGTFEKFLRRDITQGLVLCDAIVLLPGWPRSRGACVEFAAATAMGYNVGLWDNSQDRVVWMEDYRGVYSS